MTTGEYMPPASWLLDALIRIGRLPENNPRDVAINRMARRIVRMIEADDLASPEIFRNHVGDVRIVFARKGTRVEFTISRPDSFRAEKLLGYTTSRCLVVRKDYAEAARTAVGWLYPERNATSMEGMAEAVEIERL